MQKVFANSIGNTSETDIKNTQSASQLFVMGRLREEPNLGAFFSTHS
jgi:hypothetical protein